LVEHHLSSLILLIVARYGDEVENFLDVYLRTPGISNQDAARAHVARGNARKVAGEKLLVRAQQGMIHHSSTPTLT
jgi:hypothetical protein